MSKLIEEVFSTLANIQNNEGGAIGAPKPAVSIKKSITPYYLICLEDGKKFKMLKRHLKSQYNMSPEEYREKWDLSYDYPMVASNYAIKRIELAQKSGLG